MPTTPCEPVKSPCASAGLTTADWFYSLFKNGCGIISWLASIRNVLNVAANGKVLLAPSYFQVENPVGPMTVTVPAGALYIQAIIDSEYAATHRLEVFNGPSTTVKLPLGADYQLPAITPVFYAASDGSDGSRGTGVYGEVKFKFPTGSYGFVEAIYRTTPSAIVGVV